MEKTVLTTKPSQVLSVDAWILALIISSFIPVIVSFILVMVSQSFPKYAFSNTTMYLLMFVPCIIPFLWATWQTMDLNCTVYEITDQRLIRRTGVFTAVYDEIELIRVRDYQIIEPLYLRMFGLGNLHVYSSDRNTPVIEIEAQKDIKKLRDLVRHLVLERQRGMGYREVEVSG